jgi:hypothetical protein
MGTKEIYKCVGRFKGGQTNTDDVLCGWLLAVTWVEVKVQIDQHRIFRETEESAMANLHLK